MHIGENEYVASRSCSNSTSNTSPLPEQPESIANYTSVPGLDIDIIEINDCTEPDYEYSAATPNQTNATSIKVRPLDNLFENYTHHNIHHHQTAYKNSASSTRNIERKMNYRQLPSSTSISCQPEIDTDASTTNLTNDNEYTNAMDTAAEYFAGVSRQRESTPSNDNAYDKSQSLPAALKFNRDIMTIFVKRSTSTITSQMQERTRQMPAPSSDSNHCDEQFENVVCSPNIDPYDEYYDEEVEFATMDRDMDSSNELNGSMSSFHESELIICDDGDDLGSDAHSRDQFHSRMSKFIGNEGSMSAQIVGNSRHLLRRMKNIHHASINARNIKGSCGGRDKKGGYGHSMPLPSAVVLRNPRINQPRTYNTDALYAALMDVNSGESIYRYGEHLTDAVKEIG